jgi:hypothetical protein
MKQPIQIRGNTYSARVIPAEVRGAWAIHRNFVRDPDGVVRSVNQWAITHRPSGLQLIVVRSQATARNLLDALARGVPSCPVSVDVMVTARQLYGMRWYRRYPEVRAWRKTIRAIVVAARKEGKL